MKKLILTIAILLSLISLACKPDVEKYNEQGLEAKEEENYTEAIKLFTKAIKSDPNSERSYINRGHTYQLIKDYDKALADYTKAIKIDPKSVRAYIYRGLTYSIILENVAQTSSNMYERMLLKIAGTTYNDAMADLNKAIELDPKSSSAYSCRGLLNSVVLDKDKACQDWQIAVSLGDSTIAQESLKAFCK